MKPNRRAKKADASSKLILEEIIGLTTKNCNGLASNTSTSNCAYVAGCVVVVYNVDSNTQSHLMVSHRMPKPLSCVTMSSDGRFIAAGESGTQPAVIVWDSANLAYICELKGHLFGVECIDFSPDGEHLVSVGGYIYLWDWRNATLATKIKATSSCSVVTSVRFSLNSRFIVTAGKKHLKFWTVGSLPETRLNKGKTSLSMHAKPVNLGLQKGSSFVSIVNDVRFGGKFPIYALTDTGVLCLVHSGLSVTKTVDLKVEKSFAVSASDKLIACACSNGAVQLFTIESLEYAGTLHYAKSKNCNRESELDPQPPHTHLDAIACNFSTYEKLVVVYGDRSFYVWDVHDVNQATRCCVLVSHSACIWDVKNLCCENMHNPSLACVGRGCCGGVSFSTCSADGTIRLWDLGLQNSKDDVGLGSSNIGPVGATRLVSRGIFERDIIETSISAQGFRSMAVSSDGKYLAAGDSDGNLHIFDLRSSAYTCIKDAHDAEILSLSFSEERHVAGVETMGSHYFLASGGRDRTIHLYDVKRNFDLVESIEDHSAAVTSVKFTCDGYKILSCSADRSLVFRDVAVRGGNYKISRCNYQLASLGTVYDMVVDPRMEVVVTVGQDKKINSFNIAAGKLIRSLKQDKDLGDPIKVTMDPSGSYLVCSYSNKSICLYDFITGEMVSQAVGHGEVITSVIFLADCKHIVSVGGDGCIFVWKVPARFSSRMLQKVNQIFGTLSPRNFSPPITLNDIVCSEEEVEICRVVTEGMSLRENLNQIREGLHHLEDGKRQQTSAFRFSISRLPKWAQAKVTSPVMIPSNPELASFQKQLEAIKSSPSVDDVDDAYACSEVQSPSNHDLRDNGSCLSSLSRSSDAETNTRSTLSKKNASGFALDNRWLNVYTVCQDLPNSPEMQCTKDGEMPVSSLNLFQQVEHLSDGATTNEHATPNNMGNNQRIMQDQNVQSKVVSGVAERSNSDKTKVQENVDYNVCCEESDETDLFKQHFGSLSTTHKIEKRKSSGRRRFSAQYVLRREYTGDSNRLFDTPLHSGGSDTLKFREECFSHVPSESPGPQTIDSTEQEVKKLTQSSNPSSQNTEDGSSKRRINGDSVNMELMDATQCEEHILEGGGMVKNTSECKEALRNLESAAENVVQIFSGLRTMASRKEHSSGPETEIYDEAAKLLPSIAEKINTVAKMVQQRNVDLSERTAMQVSGLEPLLGTFAQSLSQKVFEILKSNLNTA